MSSRSLRAKSCVLILALVSALRACFAQSAEPELTLETVPVGDFSGQRDIGAVLHPGSAEYDKSRDAYTVTGSGANMWFTNDAFHFVFKEISGDVRITADVRFLTPGGNAHRKACLILRQSLAPTSTYADIALHGSGLTALQARYAPGENTTEVIVAESSPTTISVEKRGNYVTVAYAKEGQALQEAGGELPVTFDGPFYVGLGVCAHDENALEKAEFSNVKVELLSAPTSEPRGGLSALEVIPVNGDRHVVYTTTDHIEAPNWSKDGQYFIFNSNGRLFTLPVAGGTPTPLDTGTNLHCNNDHGLSPDGKWLAISDQSGGSSKVYVLPVGGGKPRLITPVGPSYWHGWSPDGKTLAFCGQRKGEFDVYTISAEGGAEKRLTTAPGLDDGPDYSPDGRYIYFNSVRSGSMQIWRMKADGSEQTQITSDDHDNWFAHPSPDGKWIAFLTYPKNTEGHPADKDVMLRMMPASGSPAKILTKLFGGQGTINVPSWSPDSKQIAFVSYRPVYR
jgi:sugar lactone lactonase YvrE